MRVHEPGGRERTGRWRAECERGMAVRCGGEGSAGLGKRSGAEEARPAGRAFTLHFGPMLYWPSRPSS